RMGMTIPKPIRSISTTTKMTRSELRCEDRFATLFLRYNGSEGRASDKVSGCFALARAPERAILQAAEDRSSVNLAPFGHSHIKCGVDQAMMSTDAGKVSGGSS